MLENIGAKHSHHDWKLDIFGGTYHCQQRGCKAKLGIWQLPQKVSKELSDGDLDGLWERYITVGLNGYRLTNPNAEHIEWIVERTHV